VLVAGLDSAGKTTVVLKLKRGERRQGQHVNTIPTMDFNVEQLKFNGKGFYMWDVGGQDSVRPLWRHHLTGSQALIYVVDANECARRAILCTGPRSDSGCSLVFLFVLTMNFAAVSVCARLR